MTQDDVKKTFDACSWEMAQLYAALETDETIIKHYHAFDGMRIPPSTHIEIIARLVHNEDLEVTPELMELELAGNPT